MTRTLSPVTLEEAQAARERIAGIVTRTPLVLMQTGSETNEIYLKLENLQPIGSFKLRGAANAMALAGDNALANGVYTASAGNMAQGVAWCARARRAMSRCRSRARAEGQDRCHRAPRR